MAKRKEFDTEYIRKIWGKSGRLTYGGKCYRVKKMSYGDYFLEPCSWKGGEREGFSSRTIWLEKSDLHRGKLITER